MSYVVINAITDPEGRGTELEARFAARKHAVDSEPGFEKFQLLRPAAGETRYFVLTQWATKQDFENWQDGRAKDAHSGPERRPVATGADLLEFEVVEL